jgi:hypothetical protein
VAAVVGFVAAFAGVAVSIAALSTAMENPTTPRRVPLGQVVNGEVAPSRYVTVQGYALYDTGYAETSNGSKAAEYYYVFDSNRGYAVLVKADSTDLDGRVDGPVSVDGMTTRVPSGSEFYELIASDIDYFAGEGFRITPDMYIRENAHPASIVNAAVILAGSIAIGLLSLVIALFPSVVFVPAAAQPGGIAMQAAAAQGVQATGQLQKLKRVKPSIEPGRQWRRFSKAVANIVPLANRRVMIYVHLITRYNGIPTSKTHWAVTLDAANVLSVEPGKTLAFQDRWAVRIVHRQRQGKAEELIVTFAGPEDQAHFVAMLRMAGFALGTSGVV